MSIPDPAAAVDWYFLAAGALGVVVFVYKVARRVERMNESLETLTSKEFGGNSGGMRQAINEIQQDSRFTRESMARLEGRFDQHIEEHRR